MQCIAADVAPLGSETRLNPAVLFLNGRRVLSSLNPEL